MRRFAIYSVIAIGLIAQIACNNAANQPTVVMPAQVSAKAKRYLLKGKVIAIDKQAHMLNVDGEEIPGFMSAMTMPYPVKPESALDKLSTGESITADIVVAGDSSWLENIVVVGPRGGAMSK